MNYVIGEAARRLGLTADTLRYYEKIGLVPRIARKSSGHRLYDEADLARLRFVQHAQAVGFNLREIAALLRFRANPMKSGRAVRDLAAHKRDEIESKLETLKRLHSELSLLLGLCDCHGENEPCPILDRLESNGRLRR